VFYQQLFSYLTNEVELAKFTPKMIPETDIKIEMMNACKESYLLFFEEKIEKLVKGYEINKAHTDYKNYCEEEGYNAFRNRPFGLRLDSIVNK
jgi:tRNA 2-selenouridine synthase SelU